MQALFARFKAYRLDEVLEAWERLLDVIEVFKVHFTSSSRYGLMTADEIYFMGKAFIAWAHEPTSTA